MNTAKRWAGAVPPHQQGTDTLLEIHPLPFYASRPYPPHLFHRMECKVLHLLLQTELYSCVRLNCHPNACRGIRKPEPIVDKQLSRLRGSLLKRGWGSSCDHCCTPPAPSLQALKQRRCPPTPSPSPPPPVKHSSSAVPFNRPLPFSPLLSPVCYKRQGWMNGCRPISKRALLSACLLVCVHPTRMIPGCLPACLPAKLKFPMLLY